MNKKLFIAFCLLIISKQTVAQVVLPQYPDSIFSTYYQQRLTLFNALPKTADDIVFIGNSITDGVEWSELFNDVKIKNRGISGDNSAGVLNRIHEVSKRKPAKLFLMIGINDLAKNITVDSIVKNILLLAAYLHQESITTQVYVQSVLPANNGFGKFATHTNKGSQIQEVNKLLEQNATPYHYTFVNLHPAFCDENGKLHINFTNDGLHLNGDGYMLWKHIIYPYVYDLEEKPALIPQPQSLQWNNGSFSLYNCKTIVVKDTLLLKEAKTLQYKLAEKGWHTIIVDHTNKDDAIIELSISNITAPINATESYQLEVSKNKISLVANTVHGIFNGIQTLEQLMRDGSIIDACNIKDWPSFLWRGYMVDVGRNYQSIQQLKQQIDVMAAYKLNIFHFHLTEDIAWRLESKQYPQLTASKNMLRNPGEYYRLEELKMLIAYCKERYITLIPEIDMPGHSAAFKRALGVDMQTEEGVKICKNILTELCTELDVPFVHIGGDEVTITNKEFLHQMVTHVSILGKKSIAWDPGGIVPKGTILQMWNGNSKPKPGYPAIDSRHLYLNHFDPFDGVVATFNHQVDDANTGDDYKLGAILCNWPDRRVHTESDLISMNAVYPVMLTFAERCWLGGGYKNYLSNIDLPETERYRAFNLFENRLLDHKQQLFKNKPFPYYKQSNIEWKLIGPYNNSGNTTTSFAPESKHFFDTVQLKNYNSVFGATIWLRHFWHSMIGSHLQNPTENTTWYATRSIWAAEAGEKECWIGFNNFSRSTATDAPLLGTWDNRNSAIWINGTLLSPPKWKHGGQKGDLEIPLADEGYEYRTPTKIFLQKGWNTILIKAPVSSFKGSDWQNPVKWMFTFVVL